jgi:hypothetical protein
MKIFVMCMQCQAELGHPSFEPFLADYFDEGVAYIECARGHKSTILVQSLKFEVLMESGANALLEGYTFEACAAFSAALERFYEFALRVMCKARGMPEETLGKMFAEMARQSERQLGAFMALYAAKFAEAHRPNPKIVEFRNSVIHKGVIPKPNAARKFCADVYELIVPLYAKLSEKYKEEIRKLVSQELQEKRKQAGAELPAATSTGTTFFNIAREANPASFEEALESFMKAQAVIQGAIPQMRTIFAALMAAKN